MSDPVWPLSPDEIPELRTDSGIGTMLLHNSRPDTSGRFFATAWLVILFPVLPRGRYYVRQGASSESPALGGTVHTTRYEFFGRSSVRMSEVIRCYVFGWLVVPVFFLLPSAAVLWWLTQDSGWSSGLWGFLAVAVWATLGTLLFIQYRRRWRPVREAHWIPARPSS
ncbi:hypothetical protein [Streptomyces sp. NPDC059906]|uniref:hypothetical protein n=1 Tax=Streptomyces sp. NPDC059906 TaxID=3346997 RepID=UPI0036635AE3